MQTVWIANGDFEAASREALLAQMAEYSVEHDDSIMVTRLVEMTADDEEVCHDAVAFDDEVRKAAFELHHQYSDEADYIHEVSSPYLSGRV